MLSRLLARLDLATLRPPNPRTKGHSCLGSLLRVAQSLPPRGAEPGARQLAGHGMSQGPSPRDAKR
eukprot:3203651-Pyramimonas_sp.AAC.1